MHCELWKVRVECARVKANSKVKETISKKRMVRHKLRRKMRSEPRRRTKVCRKLRSGPRRSESE